MRRGSGNAENNGKMIFPFPSAAPAQWLNLLDQQVMSFSVLNISNIAIAK